MSGIPEKYYSNRDNKKLCSIIAPSSKGLLEEIDSIKNFVRNIGYTPRISEHIYSNADPFYSNSDEFRARDLIEVLTDDSKIIWCIKGGEGASRLIPYLEEISADKKSNIAKNENKKIFIGFSDTTALHTYLHVKYKWETLHGPMLEKIIRHEVTDESVNLLTDLIIRNKSFIKFENLKMINSIVLCEGTLRSKIIGGNLTLVENSIGTIWQINAKNKIMFLEDTKEPAYSIERSLDHLRQSKIFEKVDGVIFGDFTETDNEKLVQIAMKRFAISVNFPVFTVRDIGHGETNKPLPLNTDANILDNKNGSFTLTVRNVWHN